MNLKHLKDILNTYADSELEDMKIIDLLNKIANGEQPSHIRMYGRDWYWNNFDGYVTEGSLSTTPDAQIYLFSSYRLDFALNKEVEVIEEEKEIEKLQKPTLDEYIHITVEDLYKQEMKLYDKINELIDEINKLKELNK